MKKIFLSIVVAIFATFSIAQADDLSDRKAAMKSINGYMKTLRGLKNNFSADTAAAEGANLVVAFTNVQNLFKEKGTGDTTALDTIWSDADGFSTAVSSALAAAQNIADATDESAFNDAFGQMGQSCGGCHRNYRAKR